VVTDNWALLYAQRLALREKVPLYVCFCLVPKFLQATLRQYGFMLRGETCLKKFVHAGRFRLLVRFIGCSDVIVY